MKIGFIDYFLSEWHANNYPAWIKESAKKLNINIELKFAYAELDKSPYDGITTDKWCENYNAEKCNSIEELCEKSDAIFVLSPDNPEKHLEYCRAAFKYGKPVYIDKTFAPDLEIAKKIFNIAQKYNTPIFTSSALGFADEILNCDGNLNSAITTGGGSNIETYLIHQIEMIVKMMGVGAKKLIASGNSNNSSISIAYENERHATLNFCNSYPFSIAVENKNKTSSDYMQISSAFFNNLIAAILSFFVSKKPPVSKQHTLEVMAIYDACIKSLEIPFEFVEVVK